MHGVAPGASLAQQEDLGSLAPGVSEILPPAFHEFAPQPHLQSPWAEAYYQQMWQRGLRHHDTVRALAFNWTPIIYRCGRRHTPYDEARYEQALKCRGSPLATTLRKLALQEAGT